MSTETPDLPFDLPPESTPPDGASISDPFPPRVVRASAGSGKTFDLVGRYLGLLAAGVEPEKILATTFTRKAAGEIMARILLRLAECVTDRAVLEEVREKSIPVGIPFDALRAAQLLEAVCRDLPRLQVETLDAFFHRIASGHAFELKLPPDWGIGDAATLARIRRRAIHDLLEAHPESAVELMRRLHRGEVRRSVTERLDGLVVELHHRWLESPPEAWETITPPIAPSRGQIDHARNRLATLPLPKKRDGGDVVRWVNARDALLRAIDDSDHRSLATNGLVVKILEGATAYQSKPIDPEWEEALDPILDAARHAELTQLLEQNRASLELIAAYDTFEGRRRDALGVYDFGTVTRRLAEGSVTENMLALYDRIDARIDHILLDEFQDTSLLQYAVLLPILHELLAGLPEQRTFYCVGDVKQAIYGWRGGRRALFDAVEGLLPPGSTDTKAKSWRSSPIVLETVNQVFEGLDDAFLRDDDAETAREWQSAFPPHEAAKSDLAGHVTVEIATPREDEDHVSPRELPFLRAIEAIESIQQRDPRLTIGVLLRKNDRVGPLIDLLRERDIDASQEGGNPLTDSAAVNRVLAALSFADHPADGAAHFVVATCALGAALGLEEDSPTARARAARQLRQQLVDQGYGATILTLCEQLAPSCDERDRVRLDQLIELAHRFGDETGLRPSTFVERVRKTPVESPTGSKVQVMTIHRSKGLEFDVVLLPQLTDSWFSPTPTLLASTSHPLRPADRITRYVSTSLRRLCRDQLEPIYEGHRAEIVTEAISLFYVALTRARHGLHLWLPPGKLTDSPSFARIARIQLAGEDAESTGGEDEETLLYEAGDPKWIDEWQKARPSIDASSAPPRAAIEATIAPPEPAVATTVAPPPPSRLTGGGKVSKGEGGAAARRRAMRLGTTLHALLEAIEWFPEPHPERRARAEALLPAELTSSLPEARKCLETVFQNRDAARLYSELDTRDRLELLAGVTPSRIEAAREIEYGWVPGEPGDPEERSARAGIIDRLHLAFVTEADGSERVVSAEIIDAKTTTLEGEELVKSLRASYSDQLTAYAAAVADLYSIPVDRIALKILAVPTGEVIEIDPA